ncbi:MAG: helix-turn-helix transcriptional regulator [Thermoprotei archaeon]|jgi:hypothetical protein
MSEKKVPSIEELVEKAMELIKSSENGTMVQSELWKRLGIDSKRGSRLVQRLLLENRIARTSIVIKGHKTFVLTPVKREVRIVPFDILASVPCFTCPELSRCGQGYFVNPFDCLLIGGWLDKSAKEQQKEIKEHQG